MWSYQILFALLAVCLTLPHVIAVVNNGQGQNTGNLESNSAKTESSKNDSQTTSDSVAESSENLNRREASLSDSYGAPPAINLDLPVPVYGVPNAPSNNIVYPASIADIAPPPAPKSSSLYGAPPVNFLPHGTSGPSSIKYGPPSVPNLFTPNHGPPKSIYGPPKIQYGPPKPIYGPPSKPSKYAKYPPKSNYGFKFPSKSHGGPNFSSSKVNLFHGNKFNNNNLYSGISPINHQYGAPIVGPPKVAYGVPNLSPQYGALQHAYGPPQPNPNPRPPHPGVPAPPTPPDIKYDGWQPILGAISKRPVEDLQQMTGEGYNSDLLPPPLSQNQISENYGPPPGHLEITDHQFNKQNGISDSYGVPLGAVTGSEEKHHGISNSYQAPLNTVTGAGGIVASSGDEAANSHNKGHSDIHIDLSTFGQKGSVEQIKSEGYEIFSHGGDSHASNDVYAAAHSYNNFNLGHKSQKTFSANTIGLTPPSGSYGAPPPSRQYSPPHGRRPQHNAVHSNSYLVPPPAELPGLYSLPQNSASSSSHNFAQESSHIEGAQALAFSNYNAPLSAIDGSYSLPQGSISVGLDLTHPPISIDLTQGKSNSYDCNKQQQRLPSLAYGVPSVDSYTSSLSSLTTNIANTQAQSIPQTTYGVPRGIAAEYGVPDLAHSSSIKSESKVNAVNVDTQGKTYGKSVAESLGPSSELVESQSIDLNDIPLQGSMGSYTLQIQSSDGSVGQVPHTQVLNEGLLQSILQAIEQPGQQTQINGIPIIHEQKSYTVNGTQYVPAQSVLFDNQPQYSEIQEVKAIAPTSNAVDEKIDDTVDEDTLQLLDSSPIALYYKKSDIAEDKSDNNLDKNGETENGSERV